MAQSLPSKKHQCVTQLPQEKAKDEKETHAAELKAADEKRAADKKEVCQFLPVPNLSTSCGHVALDHGKLCSACSGVLLASLCPVSSPTSMQHAVQSKGSCCLPHGSGACTRCLQTEGKAKKYYKTDTNLLVACRYFDHSGEESDLSSAASPLAKHSL